MSKVIVYSTSTCAPCKQVKAFLKQNHVEFETVNLSEEKHRLKEMVDKAGTMSVPVTVIGDEVVKGYDPLRLAELLQLNGSS